MASVGGFWILLRGFFLFGRWFLTATFATVPIEYSAYIVPDHTRETLIHRLITTHILPGTVVYSDQFSPYIPLNQLGYIHLSVNHSKNFGNPDSGAHTNTIEGLWALVKKKLKSMSGTLYEHLPSYLDEFVWFRNFAGDRAFGLGD